MLVPDVTVLEGPRVNVLPTVSVTEVGVIPPARPPKDVVGITLLGGYALIRPQEGRVACGRRQPGAH